MYRLNDLLDQISKYADNADLDLVMRAYFYAAKAHKEQVRKSGEAYFTHPLAVAAILAEMQLDVDTIATALLHDTIEDTMATREELAELFSPVIAELVDGVTKIGKLHFRSKEEAAAENFRKMMLAMSKDIRVILVKLADRLHNMRTLDSMKPEKRQRIAEETLGIYTPLAARLGLSAIRCELEDLCFQNLHPEKYDELLAKMEETKEQRDAWVRSVSQELTDRLAAAGIKGEVSGRSKHLYSVYRKMSADKLEFEQLYDILAFRVIVESLTDCYATLGYVHSFYRPLHERIKDFIAMPKSNGYQSLHTTVFGPGNKRMEIQIRTRDMHRVAEQGIAAHWRYKEGHLAIRPDDLARMLQLRELFESAKDVDDPVEFMEAVKIDLFRNEVFVFTPAGDVKSLPVGATALDFAYSIHSEVGHHCVGAKVNGRMMPLRSTLSSGDTVEILTSKDQHPRRDWLEFVKTGRAMARIRRYLRNEERETGARLGREMLENELKKFGSSINGVVKSGALKRLLKANNIREPDELFLNLAQGHTVLRAVVKELLPDQKIDETPDVERTLVGRVLDKLRGTEPTPVLIGGEEDVLVTRANCCNPLPGDPVAGYITRGRGISIHRRSCPQLLALEPERRVPVEWNAKAKGASVAAALRIICADRPGLLANITQACSDAGINITGVNSRRLNDEKAEISLEVGVASVAELQGLMRRLERIRGVITVDRAGAQS